MCRPLYFALWFLLLSVFFFFPLLISAVAEWMCTILLHMVWPSCEFRMHCRSEMYCTRLAGNARRKNDAKNRTLGTFAQLCWAVSSQLRHISRIGKKLLSSNTSSTCPCNMVNVGPLTAEIGSGVWAPSKFQRISRLGSVTARHASSRPQPNFAALNRGRHLYSAGRPSRWALAHILVIIIIIIIFWNFWAHQHKAAGLKIKLNKIKWLQRRLIR